jgi:mRNA interferase MazF
MRPGSIYLASFPFGDTPGMKIRPVLLLTPAVGTIPEVLVAYISSVVPAKLLPSDALLDPTRPEFRDTGLKTVSVLRLHRLATIHLTSLARFLVSLDISTRVVIDEKLRELLSI